MITANAIVKRFEEFATAHFFIERFTHGEPSDLDIQKNILGNQPSFPLMHVVYDGAAYAEGSKTYSFAVYIVDLSLLSVDKDSGGIQVVSDSEQCAEDLLADLVAGWNIFDVECVLSTASIEPLLHETKNVLCGVQLRLSIEVGYDYSACFAPIDGVVQADGSLPYVRRGVLAVRTQDGLTRVLSVREIIVPNKILTDLGDGKAELDFPVIYRIADIADVDVTGLNTGDVLVWDGTSDTWIPGAGGGGSTTFLGLLDTPSAYTGQQGKVVAVNTAQNALEFIDAPGGAVDSVNGQTGVVILNSVDILRPILSPITTIEDTLLEFDVIKAWYDKFIPYYRLYEQPNPDFNTIQIGEVPGTYITLNYLGGVSGALVELRAGSSFMRVNNGSGISTNHYRFPFLGPQANDMIVRSALTQTIFSAPRSGLIHFEWRTNYFNLTNGVDNVIPFTDYFGTLGKTTFDEPYLGGSGIISVPTPGLYRVEMRVHLYDQTGGMDVTAGIYNQSTAQYIQKLIDVGPTTSGSTDRIYYGMGILQLAANNYQFVINPSANSPYPSDTGRTYTSATITWLGEP